MCGRHKKWGYRNGFHDTNMKVEMAIKRASTALAMRWAEAEALKQLRNEHRWPDFWCLNKNRDLLDQKPTPAPGDGLPGHPIMTLTLCFVRRPHETEDKTQWRYACPMCAEECSTMSKGKDSGKSKGKHDRKEAWHYFDDWRSAMQHCAGETHRRNLDTMYEGNGRIFQVLGEGMTNPPTYAWLLSIGGTLPLPAYLGGATALSRNWWGHVFARSRMFKLGGVVRICLRRRNGESG